jgi:hypothetical protein
MSVKATAEFTFDRSATPSPVTNLTVTPNGPGAELAFSRSSEPDFFALRIDGDLVYDRLTPSDFLTAPGATTYALVYHGATPNQSHTFEIEAVVNNTSILQHSENNTIITTTPEVASIWLVDSSEAPYSPSNPPMMVRIDGVDDQQLGIGESSNTYYPVGSRIPVTVTDSIRGIEGTLTGTVVDDSNGYVDNLRFMKQPEQVGKTYRLIYGSVNIPVQLSVASTFSLTFGGSDTYNVSIDVAQVGEFE